MADTLVSTRRDHIFDIQYDDDDDDDIHYELDEQRSGDPIKLSFNTPTPFANNIQSLSSKIMEHNDLSKGVYSVDLRDKEYVRNCVDAYTQSKLELNDFLNTLSIEKNTKYYNIIKNCLIQQNPLHKLILNDNDKKHDLSRIWKYTNYVTKQLIIYKDMHISQFNLVFIPCNIDQIDNNYFPIALQLFHKFVEMNTTLLIMASNIEDIADDKIYIFESSDKILSHLSSYTNDMLNILFNFDKDRTSPRVYASYGSFSSRIFRNDMIDALKPVCIPLTVTARNNINRQRGDTELFKDESFNKFKLKFCSKNQRKMINPMYYAMNKMINTYYNYYCKIGGRYGAGNRWIDYIINNELHDTPIKWYLGDDIHPNNSLFVDFDKDFPIDVNVFIVNSKQDINRLIFGFLQLCWKYCLLNAKSTNIQYNAPSVQDMIVKYYTK